MLSKQKLTDEIHDAFKKGLEKEKISTSDEEEKTFKSVYTESNMAGFLADAIAKYASDAETILQPGPFLYPAPPPVLTSVDPTPPTVPAKVSDTDSTKGILTNAFNASFQAQDPSMALVSLALVSYCLTLVNFKSSIGCEALGVTTMFVPPVFLPNIAAGLAGGSLLNQSQVMASTIHASFMSCKFSGTVIKTSLGAAGPVIMSPLF